MKNPLRYPQLQRRALELLEQAKKVQHEMFIEQLTVYDRNEDGICYAEILDEIVYEFAMLGDEESA